MTRSVDLPSIASSPDLPMFASLLRGNVPLCIIDCSASRATLAENELKNHPSVEGESATRLSLLAGVQLVAANSACLTLFGASGVHELKESFASIFGVDGRATIAELVHSSSKGALCRDFEAFLELCDGRRVEARVTWDVVEYSQERLHVLLTILDVSAEKLREQLQQAESQRTALAESIPDLVFELSADGVYLSLIGPRDAPHGISERSLGKRVEEVWPQELARATLEAAERVGRDGGVQTFDYSLRTGDAVRWFEARMVAAPHGGTISVVRETTDRKRTELKLAESELRFRTMADSAPVMLWMSGTDSLCEFFNYTWLEFTGRTMQEEYGNGWAEGVHPEDFQRCMHTYLDSFVARLPFRMEYRLRRADGEYRWILDQGVPRYGPEGRFAGYIGSCVDITEQKELQSELDGRVRQRTEQLATALEELEAFCYSVSHDLRAPLRAMGGFSQALVEEYGEKFDATGLSYLNFVSDAAQRMSRLIDDLLKLSRLGRGEVWREALDLSHLARKVVDQLQMCEPERQVTWDIEEAIEAFGDASLLRTVLENLLGNAFKFTARSSDPVIRFGRAKQGAQFVYFVEDNGVGFDMKHAGSLFGPFRRLHGEGEFPGNGVGLASVQRIIHRHGGRIWAKAEVGKGAKFFWTLPAIVDPDSAVPSSRTAR
jgi:PAS domain S-box-containing protein